MSRQARQFESVVFNMIKISQKIIDSLKFVDPYYSPSEHIDMACGHEAVSIISGFKLPQLLNKYESSDQPHYTGTHLDAHAEVLKKLGFKTSGWQDYRSKYPRFGLAFGWYRYQDQLSAGHVVCTASHRNRRWCLEGLRLMVDPMTELHKLGFKAKYICDITHIPDWRIDMSGKRLKTLCR